MIAASSDFSLAVAVNAMKKNGDKKVPPFFQAVPQ